MDRHRYRSPYCSCNYPHEYAYEPWSLRRTIVTWVVTGLCLFALAIGSPLLRNANERSWCSGGVGGVGAPVSRQCLDEQRDIRCGPLGIFHCPEGD
jgi:hypothetical protein